MGTSKVAFVFAALLCALPNFSGKALIASPISDQRTFPQHIPYLAHIGKLDAALALYQKAVACSGRQDSECLEQIGLTLLQQGARSDDPESMLLTLYGASIALDERAFDILEDAVQSPVVPLQMAALHLVANNHTVTADQALFSALQSNSLVVRLEAAHYIAQRRLPGASSHIASLLNKVSDKLWPLFCPLFGAIGDAESMCQLRKMLSHSSEEVRIAAILSCAAAGRDDLLPRIRILASQPSLRQREACALAFQILRDSTALPLLHQYAQSSVASLRLAALRTLFVLGDNSAAKSIGIIASGGLPLAVSLLGDIAGSEELLCRFLSCEDLTMRLNAALALLKLSDVRCVPVLKEILLKDARDLAFEKMSTPGHACSFWKAVPSARQNLADDPLQLESSLLFREDVVAAAASLPEESFLHIAEVILELQQSDLIPVLMIQLEAIASPAVVALLQRYQQRVGAPLVRHWCNLVLYRLKEEGPYLANLKSWLQQQRSDELIQLRPQVPVEWCEGKSSHQVTPHERSRLLVESFTSMAQRQDDEGINILIEAIRWGHPKNKYALAGLLIRASR